MSLVSWPLVRGEGETAIVRAARPHQFCQTRSGKIEREEFSAFAVIRIPDNGHLCISVYSYTHRHTCLIHGPVAQREREKRAVLGFTYGVVPLPHEYVAVFSL